eukprot:jgi/Botrbrau1/16394/Bobra.0387s0004.1
MKFFSTVSGVALPIEGSVSHARRTAAIACVFAILILSSQTETVEASRHESRRILLSVSSGAPAPGIMLSGPGRNATANTNSTLHSEAQGPGVATGGPVAKLKPKKPSSFSVMCFTPTWCVPYGRR